MFSSKPLFGVLAALQASSGMPRLMSTEDMKADAIERLEQGYGRKRKLIAKTVRLAQR